MLGCGSRAHPRSRGENLAEQGWDAPALGSSPLTRGKPGPAPAAGPSVGLIPAHAGKTGTGRHSRRGSRAHPRSRGENERARQDAGIPWGSSPLTRGKQYDPKTGHAVGGLIPAHAGKTASRRQRSRSIGAHPRSRGENHRRRPFLVPVSGSSPLTRGKLRQRRQGHSVHGLIPAHAGKTQGGRERFPRARAHPRSRGENAGSSACGPRARGSSPLTRGKPKEKSCTGPKARLIPAHAGKTRRRLGMAPRNTAHPRSRGENEFDSQTNAHAWGSSPLTRGKPA